MPHRGRHAAALESRGHNPALAHAHMPTYTHTLGALSVVKPQPPNIAPKWHEMFLTSKQPRDTVARNLVLEYELRNIVSILADSDIPLLVLKGIPLTRRLHGSLSARKILDNDILVPRSDVPRAARCLERLGYRLCDYHTIEGDLRSNFQSVLFRDLPNGFRLWVELHWSAFPTNMFSVSERLQWARSETAQLGPTPMRVFDPTMTIIHLASHFAQHLCAEPRILRDVAAAWRRWGDTTDPADLHWLASATGVTNALAYSLNAAKDLGWVRQPLPVFDAPKATMLAKLLPSHQLLSQRASLYRRALLTTLLIDAHHIPAWLMEQAVPPLDRMAAIYQQPVSARLLLRYPTRPFRALRRILRGEQIRSTRQ